MCSFSIIFDDPFVKIRLQLIKGCVDFLSERDLIKLGQNRFIKALDDTVGLRVPRLGPCVINVVKRQIELIVVLLWLSAVFGPTVGQNSEHR